MNSFSCMQQILINSLFIFILLQIFSNFPCYGFLEHPFKSGHLIFKYMDFLKVFLILSSHFDINFSFKYFLIWLPCFFFFFSLLTFLRFSMAKPIKDLSINVTLHLKKKKMKSDYGQMMHTFPPQFNTWVLRLMTITFNKYLLSACERTDSGSSLPDSNPVLILSDFR